MVDAQVSGTCRGSPVKVRVFSRAPTTKKLHWELFFILNFLKKINLFKLQYSKLGNNNSHKTIIRKIIIFLVANITFYVISN